MPFELALVRPDRPSRSEPKPPATLRQVERGGRWRSKCEFTETNVVFLRAAGGKIVFLREYFDPVRAAKALDTPILSLDS